MTKIERPASLILIILLVILIPAAVFPQEEKKKETAVIPGDPGLISSYTNFFYNYPSEDFFYHLNDRLLFMEKPDEVVMGNGQRTKLLKIVRWHKLIRKAIHRIKRDENNMITLDVEDSRGFQKAAILMNLLGLKLVKTEEGKYRVFTNPASGGTDYLSFLALNRKVIETQLNKTHHLHIKIAESGLHIPWDFQFLSRITGLRINSETFFETMLKDERFSLLLGVLYRLSDREIQYISGLLKSMPLAAWKQIYSDKKFLMGMFVLSDALRLGNDGFWLLPGGTAAEDFWTKLVGKNHKQSPLGFLYNLAVKDEGKLNYFYLFSMFLQPEKQQSFFTGANAEKMAALYQQVTLTGKEKLVENDFPAFGNMNFFTSLYSLHMKGDRLDFPRGIESWLNVIKGQVQEEAPLEFTEAETAGVPTDEEKEDEIALASFSQDNIRRKKTFLRKIRDGFYISIGIGGSPSGGGDFQTMLDVNKPFYDNLLIPSPYKEFPFFLSYGGEIGFARGRFSFGIETGNITKSFEVEKPLNYREVSTSGFSTQHLSAIPLLLNIRYTLLDTNWVKGRLSVGAGVYWGRYSRHIKYRIVDYTLPAGIIQEKGTKVSPGYHVGLTFDFFVSNRLAFFIDSRYRFVEFSGMKGSGFIVINSLDRISKTKYTGDLNFYDGGDSGRAEFYIGTRDYEGPLENLRSARFTLNGFALSIGAKICL